MFVWQWNEKFVNNQSAAKISKVMKSEIAEQVKQKTSMFINIIIYNLLFSVVLEQLELSFIIEQNPLSYD